MRILNILFRILYINVYFGRHISSVPDGSLIFFPYNSCQCACGISAILSIKKTKKSCDVSSVLNTVFSLSHHTAQYRYDECDQQDLDVSDNYLGGCDTLAKLYESLISLKKENQFIELIKNTQLQEQLRLASKHIQAIIDAESAWFSSNDYRLSVHTRDLVFNRLETLKDIGWCLQSELIVNIQRIIELIPTTSLPLSDSAVRLLKKINGVLNSIDRLEVRGRDSAGITIQFFLDQHDYSLFLNTLQPSDLDAHFNQRCQGSILLNKSIRIYQQQPSDINLSPRVSIAFTYKFAAEIGKLGDNVQFIRNQIHTDDIFHSVLLRNIQDEMILSHTRWASVGEISEANCHPQDNDHSSINTAQGCLIYVCLNGDIDNYLELKEHYEQQFGFISKEITTDTKIIPLQIDAYIKQGHDIQNAFLLAINDFEGSHAICMYSDSEPGKLYLAQKGSGQTLFVGISDDYYIPTSEVYGFVEETFHYVKMEGEKQLSLDNHRLKSGQLFILNANSEGSLDGIQAMYYDGTPIQLTPKDIKHTDITSRDIDRQGYTHYFLKEISESPNSILKTLNNRWYISDSSSTDPVYTIYINGTQNKVAVPESILQAFDNNRIRRIYFIGQGTAGIAASACTTIMEYYFNDPTIQIRALKSSELSGFYVHQEDASYSLSDTLVIAISQSGTTTDTNRCVDMVKAKGAFTISIVNRRDSDLTFKTNGVLYTSNGRDIEMSVASTKAFYSQIVAGALLSLHLAAHTKRRNSAFISNEIKQLIALPAHMKQVLGLSDQIKASADELALKRMYWAVVGSGPNKAASDEIRIKLSELCYKTISTDYVEDKKHIDLSSEPLILVCAAGTRQHVLTDLIKDTAIFKAHKAVPIVIANEDEHRFDPYADSVFHVPAIAEHLAPILNTLVGHLWGYYAALCINDSSTFLFRHREKLQKIINDHLQQEQNIYELILEKQFREAIANFYRDVRNKINLKLFPPMLGYYTITDISLILKYLSGRLPVSDFQLDFDMKGTPVNMLDCLFQCIGNAISSLARPIDAIKHQAKTVTVGTSRIIESFDGIVFESLAAHNIKISQIINKNVIVLKNLQGILSEIKGSVLYQISGLNLLGEPIEDTKIEVVEKRGLLTNAVSRVETDRTLKGTKRIIVREGNVYIGKGLKDGRSILVIPIISASVATPNLIEYLLLLNIAFKQDHEVPLLVKIKALGGKYERIRNMIQENSVVWDDRLLECIEMENLFGYSAEKVANIIISTMEVDNR
ncbi:MAG: SIS domain-containing protein [Desulfobacterales bacterium]|nr:SIS domain-containing protein [Desulfobacterales bacterium]